MNKYFAKKVKRDGETFDSKKEYQRWKELQLMDRAGQIKELKRQVRYMVLPAQYNDDGVCIERGITYIADFVYKTKNGELIVEDVKGKKTPEYIMKRKMMLYFYGIRILET